MSEGHPDTQRRFLSLGSKLALAMGAVITVASGLVFLELSRREEQSLIAQKTTAAAMVADLFAVSLSAPLDFGDADAVDVELAKLHSSRDIVYAAVWSEGGSRPLGELGASGGSPRALPSDRDKDRLSVFDDRVEVVRLVVGRDDKHVGGALLTFSLAAEKAAFESTRARLFWISLGLAFGTMALLLGIVRRQIVAPLERLGGAANRLARGETGTKVAIASRDEIGRLGDAFNAMSAAISDREERLAAANRSIRELFDHMRQAIVVFDRDGVVGDACSHQATVVFGAPTLEGRNVTELLYPGFEAWTPERTAFTEWLELAFEVPLTAWDELRAVAPREVALAGAGGERILELELEPVLEDGKVARVMLLATDVSETRGLERAARVQGAAHERQIAAMRRLVAGGGQVFVAFLDGSRRRLERCEELLSAELRVAGIEELFQHVHTMKGEALAFDLEDLASPLAHFEERLREVRNLARAAGRSTSEEERAEFVASIDSAKKEIDENEARFIDASPIGKSALDQVTVRRSDLARLGELLAGRSDELAEIASRLASRPFGESVVNLGEKIPTWAEREDKRAVVAIEGREVLVPPRLAGVLGGIVTQLCRNAIAHGIEPPEERERLGKPPVAVITVRCTASEEGPTIVVEDDGRGIAKDRVRESAGALGLSGDDARELIFAAGVSTTEAPSTLAGNGVGLAAARADLVGIGYEIAVDSEDGLGARFSVRPLRQRNPDDRSIETWKKGESSSLTTAGSSSSA